jgi:SAM-dependent methyltransferase
VSSGASRFVGSIPENYDRGLGPHIFADYAHDPASRVAPLDPESVLELATGTGIATRISRDVLPVDCELVASDLNPARLEVSRTKFRLEEAVRFEPVDASNLRLDDERFDLLACQFGVMFFPDQARSFAEVLRVLKPGGHYVFNVWDSWASNPFARLTHEVVAEFFPEDPPGFYRVPFSYHDVDVIVDAVSSAGFVQATVEHVPLRSKIPSPDDFARGLVFGNPLLEEVVLRSGDPQQICGAVADAIREELGDEMPLQAIVVHAAKR